MRRGMRRWVCALLAAVAVVTGVLPACATENVTSVEVDVAGETTVPQEIETIPEAVQTQPSQETQSPEEDPQTALQEDPEAPAEEDPEAVPEESSEALPEEASLEETADYPLRNGLPLFLQTDYPDVRYGSGMMPTSGCGITCLAMVATYLTGHTYYPDELAGYFGGYVGSNIQRLEYASDQLQLPWRKAENWHEALAALKEGKLIIALMNSRSPFTDGQHFILITGLTEEGKVLVSDPSGPNYDVWELKDGFENGFHPTTISNGYSGSWIYDPAAMPEEPFVYEEEEVVVECRYPGLTLGEEDVEILARLVWMEAQGEPVEGQQAVAEVILNRVVADNFPDTVKGVVFAEDQFRSAQRLEMAEPTQTQYEAVEQALKGPYVLPKDVVFFATYKVNSSLWGKIGGHYFCYQWDMEPYEVQQAEETGAPEE